MASHKIHSGGGKKKEESLLLREKGRKMSGLPTLRARNQETQRSKKYRDSVENEERVGRKKTYPTSLTPEGEVNLGIKKSYRDYR